MRSCGVVVEYNPFHNGHLLHLNKAKELSKADVVIAVMSGNFLQRGEPAIVDKWTRAEMALQAGVDLVVELPTAFSVQPADFFAKGAIALLHSLGCDQFCFGTESGETQDYQQLAEVLVQKKEKLDEEFLKLKNNGMTYAEQMAEAMKKITPGQTLQMDSPNNILGLAYARENLSYPRPMFMHAIRREGAGYHEESLENKRIASATAIRKVLLETGKGAGEMEKVRHAVPESSYRLLKQSNFVNWNHYWPLLQYQIKVQDAKDLERIYQMNEGVEHRLKDKVKNATSFEGFVSAVKTKRMTWTRIQRICVYVLLQMKEKEMDTLLEQPAAIRILGFSPAGREYLKRKKQDFTLPVITNLNKKNDSLWRLDVQAGEIYRLGLHEGIAEQDYRRQPVQIGRTVPEE